MVKQVIVVCAPHKWLGVPYVVVEYKGTTYIRAHEAYVSHWTTLAAFADEVGAHNQPESPPLYENDEEVGRCIGGGRIGFKPDAKYIVIGNLCEIPGARHEPDRAQTAALLQKEYPDYCIEYHDL